MSVLFWIMFQISQENNYQTAVLPRLNGQNKRIGEGNRNSGLYSAAVPAAVAGPASATKDKDPHHLQQQQLPQQQNPQQQPVYKDPRANNLYDSNCIYRAQQTPHPHHNHRLNPRSSPMPVTSIGSDPSKSGPSGPIGQPPSYSHIYKNPHLYHQLPQQPSHHHKPQSRTPDSIFDVSHREMEVSGSQVDVALSSSIIQFSFGSSCAVAAFSIYV